MRRGILAAAVVAAALLASATTAGAALPPIKHVFIIVLENKGFNETWGDGMSAPRYLTKDLATRGEVLEQYYGVAHLSHPNYVAMVSGQPPNSKSQSDCLKYEDMIPGVIGSDGIAVGQGCILPSGVKSIADQLEAKGLRWKGYMEDMEKTADRDTCRHPAVGDNDPTVNARPGDEYVVRHNPFMYFHSIIDNQARCDAHDVPLTRLPGDLTSVATTPNYSFIVPNMCNDAHDPSETSSSKNCKTDGKPGGLVRIDPWLKKWVPRILASPAYKKDGLLLITFDEARWSQAEGGTINPNARADASACCNEQPGPNTINPGGPIPGPGGGHIGTLLLSRYVKPGTRNKTPYNHYAMLRSLEDLFRLPHLGFAAQAGLRPFGSDVFNNPQGNPKPPPVPPRPTVNLTKPPSECVRSKFKVTATATGSGVTLTVDLDGREVRRTRGRSVTLTISGSHAKPGRHTILAAATDRLGRRATRSRTFVRCGSD